MSKTRFNPILFLSPQPISASSRSAPSSERLICWLKPSHFPAFVGVARPKNSARFGVKEYRIGDAASQSFEILALKDGRCDLFSSAEGQGRFTLAVLTGWEFDLADLH